jgi:hypothetical protein
MGRSFSLLGLCRAAELDDGCLRKMFVVGQPKLRLPVFFLRPGAGEGLGDGRCRRGAVGSPVLGGSRVRGSRTGVISPVGRTVGSDLRRCSVITAVGCGAPVRWAAECPPVRG